MNTNSIFTDKQRYSYKRFSYFSMETYVLYSLEASCLDDAVQICTTHHIWSKNSTMHWGFFFKLLGKLVVKYVSTYTQGSLKNRSEKDLSNDAYGMFFEFLLFWFSS